MYRLDPADVERAAEVCDSNEQIADALGIGLTCFYERKKGDPEFSEAIRRGKAKAILHVGSKLMEQIDEGNVTAMIFYLKCRAGWKETDRHELTGADGADIGVQTKVSLTDEQLDRLIDFEISKRQE